jgi:hypothetical protein
MAEDVDVRVRLREQQKFNTETKKAAAGVEGIGKAAKRASGHFGGANRQLGLLTQATKAARTPFSHLSGEAKGLAKQVLAVGLAYTTVAGLKGAVNTTVDLGKATIGLNRNLGLSVATGSAWAAVAKQRGIGNKALIGSFTTLSKQVEAANQGYADQRKKLSGLGHSLADEAKRRAITAAGAGKQAEMFKRLGISQKELRAGSKDFHGLLLKTADGFGSLAGGTKRQALAQQLLGRGYQSVLPLFSKGSKTLNEQMGLAKKYGATLSDKNIKQIQEYIAAQREMQFAEMGWQVTMGTLILPTLTKFAQGVAKLSQEFRDGTGTGGKIKDTLNGIWKDAKPTVVVIRDLAGGIAKFTRQNPDIAKAAIAIGAVGLAVNKIRTARAVDGLWTLARVARRIGSRAGAGYAVSTAEGIATTLGPSIGRRDGRIRGPLARIMRRAGSGAGAAAAAKTAEGLSLHLGDEMGKRRGTMAAATKTLARGLGVTLGGALAAGFAYEASLQINTWLRQNLGNWAADMHAQLSSSPFGGFGPTNPIAATTSTQTAGSLITNAPGGSLGAQIGGTTGHRPKPARTPRIAMPRIAAAGPVDLGALFVVENHNTLELDGQVAARSVGRSVRIRRNRS